MVAKMGLQRKTTSKTVCKVSETFHSLSRIVKETKKGKKANFNEIILLK